eukprot:1764966-Karenia_brevis.AAC.1
MFTDGSGGDYSQDPTLRRCGWSWIVDTASSYCVSSPVAYYGKPGSMDGRQTVPRAEFIAVTRALLVVEANGDGIAKMTVWSDSKISKWA